MTVLTAMQSAAVRLLGRRPQVFFGSSQKFEIEVTDLVNEIAVDVAKYRDWQALTRIHTLTGDGTTTDFDLPSDYDRQLIRSDVQELQSWFWGYRHVSDINDFMALDARGFSLTPGAWILYQNQMHFTPAPSTGPSASFPYITNRIVRDPQSGDAKSSFTADTDEFLLPERLLTLGLVWRWRENKKLDFTGDQETFIRALDDYAAKDAGSRVYRSNARRFMPGTRLAWPGTLGGV